MYDTLAIPCGPSVCFLIDANEALKGDAAEAGRMSLQQFRWLGRALYPNGEDGITVGIPAAVRDDLELTTHDCVDLEYDREEETLKIHF